MDEKASRPGCCTDKCMGMNANETMMCYTAGGNGENGQPKDPVACYHYFEKRLSQSGGRPTGLRYRGGKGHGGPQARQTWGRR